MNRRTFLSLAATASAAAQQAKRPLPADESQTITLEVTRVNLLYTVSDKRGRFVNNLTKDDFEITENKKRQAIMEFAAETNLPLRIAMLVDTSNSIRDRFRFELEAAGNFLQSVIRSGTDRAVIYGFDTEPHLVQDMTDDTELLSKKLRELRPGGGTALYETMYGACRDRLMLEESRHRFRHALVVVGDGDDNASRYSRDQALEMAQKADVVIYAISTNMTRRETDGDKVLKYFCRETGGLAFFPFKAEDLARDFENIANELRSQYRVLYRPEPWKADGLFHEIDIRVKGRTDVTVRARKGYYAQPR
ncbi:MAG: VWA domain-containing protein [Candidatus Solibacter usitatus]|nr:VWA domain-containing protein [Candidatus Solibacter usitatus]